MSNLCYRNYKHVNSYGIELKKVIVNYKPSAKNQPIWDFLNSVGGQLKETEEDGCHFLFPSSFCQAIAYNPESTNFPEELPVRQSTAIAPIQSQSALIERIANQLYDVEQISQAIESQKPCPQEEQHSSVSPTTDTEKQLVPLWSEVLRLEKVGIKDNFFDLGGNSLLAVQLMSQVRETFQVELPLNQLLDVPTVESLGRSIEASQRGEETIDTVNSFLDLEAEAVLDSAIAPGDKFDPRLLREVKNIFLTGARGFLGAFFLRELLQKTQAQIYCLVRASDILAARQKIRNNMADYQIWQEDFSSRILPILGDLSLPLLGLSPAAFQHLSDRLDVIYHNGAFVNFTYPYARGKQLSYFTVLEAL